MTYTCGVSIEERGRPPHWGAGREMDAREEEELGGGVGPRGVD